MKESKLQALQDQVYALHQSIQAQKNPIKRLLKCIQKWGLMLYREVLRDDLTIRAESLSYFSLFSLLPLLSGVFLILSFFSQWGPVQSQFDQVLERIFSPIPTEERLMLLKYVQDFRVTYLKELTQKSASIGVFALAVLGYIGVKVFFNLENLMNQIWYVQKGRSLTERLKNFALVSLLVPLTLVAILSANVLTGAWIEFLVLPFIILIAIFAIFRFLPNTDVSNRSAFMGALFSLTLFLVMSQGLKLYFKSGMQDAYGQLAVLPILAFFIYLCWMILMLGAEISYLIEYRHEQTLPPFQERSVSRLLGMLTILKIMHHDFQIGRSPRSLAEWIEEVKAPRSVTLSLLQTLEGQGRIVRLKSDDEGPRFLLKTRLDQQDLVHLEDQWLQGSAKLTPSPDL